MGMAAMEETTSTPTTRRTTDPYFFPHFIFGKRGDMTHPLGPDTFPDGPDTDTPDDDNGDDD